MYTYQYDLNYNMHLRERFQIRIQKDVSCSKDFLNTFFIFSFHNMWFYL